MNKTIVYKPSSCLKAFLVVAVLILVTICFAGASTQNQVDKAGSNASLVVTVVDKSDQSKIPFVVIVLEPYQVWGVTNTDGKAVIKNVPVSRQAQYEISASLLGYRKFSMPITLQAGQEKVIKIEMEVESLAIEGVVVVAESNRSGESTSTRIGRQALDHLQATSLKDVMQLLPGHTLSSNPNLTRAGYMQMRTLYSSNVNTSFGTSIMVDGIPVSNNASMDFGLSWLREGSGVDLRTIGTDDIESVEIIRGVPSAAYGDVSSGTVIIKNRIGVSDLNINAKIMPGITQLSAGKGFRFGESGSLNVSADYARGKSDPRYLTDTYDRLLASVIHSDHFFNHTWSVTNRINLRGVKDWTGADPSEPEVLQNFYQERNEYALRASHSGKINMNKLFSRVIQYDLSFSYAYNHLHKERLLSSTQMGFMNANVEGTYFTYGLPSVYNTRGGNKSEPISFYLKASNTFFLNTDRLTNRFNMGVSFSSEGNKGIGIYDRSDQFPEFPVERSRSYHVVPFMNQFSAYLEDNITLDFGPDRFPVIKAQLGLRFDWIQPGREEQLNSLSPRINASIQTNQWLLFRVAYGIAEKAPSLRYLYPEQSYYDFYNINISDGVRRYFLYTTRIFDSTHADLQPMRNTKYELGMNIDPGNSMHFALTGFYEETLNGFSFDRNNWVSLVFDRWVSPDVHVADGQLHFDATQPSFRDTLLYNDQKAGNQQVHISKGLEFDFDLGRLERTNTSFHLNGAYSWTRYSSSNHHYRQPTGATHSYGDVYMVYQDGSGTYTQLKRFSSALRLVQHIPAINFVVSATAQAVFYDYNHSIQISDRPMGYLKPDVSGDWQNDRGGVVYVRFTQEQFDDPEHRFEGFLLRDQIHSSSSTNAPVIWPAIWSINLRATKDINQNLGFSFYVNNLLYYQPWHTSSTGANPVERNSSLFSYGFEMRFKL